MDQPDRRYLREQLAPLQFALPFRLSSQAPELKELFRLYGFDQLVSKTGCKYHAGQVRLGGYQCVGHCWRPIRANTQLPRQTVVIAHGLFDHSGLYLKLVESLLTANKNVFIADFPGHGLSEGEAASITDFGEYAKVIGDSVLMFKQHPEEFGEICLLGQSTGAAAVLRYLLDDVHGIEVEKVVLLAPLLRIRGWSWIKLVYPLLSPLCASLERKFRSNTNDPAFLEFIRDKDVLQPREIPLRWVGAMLNAAEWLENHAGMMKNGQYRQQNKSALLIQGERDETVNWRHNLPLISSFFKQAEIVRIPEARHHLVNEIQAIRYKIFATVIKFLASRQSL